MLKAEIAVVSYGACAGCNGTITFFVFEPAKAGTKPFPSCKAIAIYPPPQKRSEDISELPQSFHEQMLAGHG